MELQAFLMALLAIVVIDVVLAGDNAIVIALAARALPAHLQRRAILWGAVGAIAVRGLMTVLVVWLLQVPGLLLAGGAMLLWIAYRLLVPDTGGSRPHETSATSLWGALRTIVIADAVMGLDNVLAVAGAAHGSYGLVITGLLISVPIVVWGSTLVLKLVERYPGIIYLGAAVLVGTAVKMITSEPLLRPSLDDRPWLVWLGHLAIPAVLWAGFVKNHRQFASRIHARLAEFRPQWPLRAGAAPLLQAAPVTQAPGARPMLKVLIPVDGSANALRAVRHAVAEYERHHDLELHLLNVRPRLSYHLARFVSRSRRNEWHREQAEAAMASARALLMRAGLPHATHWSAGRPAAEICRLARQLGVHHIVIGTARHRSVTRMWEDSVTHRVLEATPVPVEVVVGDAVSRWERWGLPAGALALAGGLMLLAVD